MVILLFVSLRALPPGAHAEENKGISAFYGFYTTDRLELSGSLAVNIGSHTIGIGRNAALACSSK